MLLKLVPAEAKGSGLTRQDMIALSLGIPIGVPTLIANIAMLILQYKTYNRRLERRKGLPVSGNGSAVRMGSSGGGVGEAVENFAPIVSGASQHTPRPISQRS
jgi:hypothetical protein